MRIYLKLSKNKGTVPFDYQSKLVGRLHKWLGENDEHGALSLYSFSWLSNARKVEKGFNFPQGSTWHINSHDETLLKTLVKGIRDDNEVMYNMYVQEVIIEDNPYFEVEQKFMVASPVFIKKTIGKEKKYYYFNDAESTDLLTNTLKNKLKKAGLDSENVSVQFDTSYPNARIKLMNYKGVENKGSICPIIIKGSPEQIAFAWNVGVGNSTGIGFGSLV